MTIYNDTLPMQIHHDGKGYVMTIHEKGKEDITVAIPDSLVPALNALRNLVATCYEDRTHLLSTFSVMRDTERELREQIARLINGVREFRATAGFHDGDHDSLGGVICSRCVASNNAALSKLDEEFGQTPFASGREKGDSR